MEGDLASLIFELDFDNEVHLIENPHSQADPSQQNTTPVHLSHEKNGEKGSSSGSGNLPASNSKQKLIITASSADANNENVDASNENAPSLASLPPPPQMPSTVTPGANNNPTKESSEFLIQAAGEKNNEAVGDDQNNEKLGSSSNALIQSSISMEHVELGSSTGSNQSFLFNTSSSHHNIAQQNLMGSTNLGFWGNIDPSLLNAQNMQQNKSNLFNPPSSEAPRQNPHQATVEIMQQFSRVSEINSENELNSNHLNRLSCTPPENSHQNQHLLPQGMNHLNLSNSLGAGDNNTSFLQSSTWLGNANQQLPNWFSSQNATFLPLTQSRPQANQFLAPNIFDSQFANNSMSPGSSVPLRAQHPVNNPGSKNFLNSFSMMPEQSLLIRPQNLAVESNQLLPFAANAQETHGSTNTMLPAVSMPLRQRPPQFPQLNEQLNNQAAVTQDLFNLQTAKPLQLNNSLLSRAQNFDLQGLLNQPIRPIPTYPTPVSSLQLTNQLLNSPTQQDIFGGNNPPGSTPQLELSLDRNNEQSFLRRRNRASNMYDIGESSSSSSSSKRSKISHFLETGSTSQSRENELETLLAANPFNHPRAIKNALYDPIFESLGLPIDPHLRMFTSSNQ